MGACRFWCVCLRVYKCFVVIFHQNIFHPDINWLKLVLLNLCKTKIYWLAHVSLPTSRWYHTRCPISMILYPVIQWIGLYSSRDFSFSFWRHNSLVLENYISVTLFVKTQGEVLGVSLQLSPGQARWGSPVPTLNRKLHIPFRTAIKGRINI